MKISTLEDIFDSLGYSAITSEFTEIPNIARINLINDGALYRSAPGTVKYYLDTSKKLLYRDDFDTNGNELGIILILNTDDIVSIETRNAYSMSSFSGNVY